MEVPPSPKFQLRDAILPSLDEQGVFYTLEDTPVVTGEELTDAL